MARQIFKFGFFVSLVDLSSLSSSSDSSPPTPLLPLGEGLLRRRISASLLIPQGTRVGTRDALRVRGKQKRHPASLQRGAAGWVPSDGCRLPGAEGLQVSCLLPKDSLAGLFQDHAFNGRLESGRVVELLLADFLQGFNETLRGGLHDGVDEPGDLAACE